MRRFIASEVRVKALFLDSPDVVDDAIAMGNGLVTVNNGYLTININGKEKPLGSDEVLVIDENGNLNTMNMVLFRSVFHEYELPTYTFGQAVDMVSSGKRMARKAWGEGVYLKLISPAVEMNPFVGIFDGVLKPYVPGSDTMLADDFVEVE